MAFVINRGTQKEPRFHARFQDAFGKWTQKKVPAKATAEGATYREKEKRAQRWADDYQDSINKAVAAGRPDPSKTSLCGELMDEWSKGLTNRNALNDRNALKLHVRPFFAKRKITEVDQHLILDWIDRQRQTPKKRGKGMLSDATIGGNLGLISRFLSWCMPRHIAANPAIAIEQRKRPQGRSTVADAPWIEDDKTVRDLYRVLPSPFNLMFYIGNRGGLRTGELCGLRLSSFDLIDEGTIRVRWNYDAGYLKEDKAKRGKHKLAPAPVDVAELVKPWIERRKAEGATGESLMFPNPRNKGRAFTKIATERAWKKACKAIALVKPHPDDGDLAEDKRRKVPFVTWYEGTRHSFASRVMKETRGKALYEVSRALGHSSVAVTEKHYQRWIVTSFSAELRQGLGLEVDKGGTITPMKQVV